MARGVRPDILLLGTPSSIGRSSPTSIRETPGRRSAPANCSRFGHEPLEQENPSPALPESRRTLPPCAQPAIPATGSSSAMRSALMTARWLAASVVALPHSRQAWWPGARRIGTFPSPTFFQVALADDGRMDAIWPEKSRLPGHPVLVFDRRDTYLFPRPERPRRFTPTAPDPGVFIHRGPASAGAGKLRDPAGRGAGWRQVSSPPLRNERARPTRRRTWPASSCEQFHVFQRTPPALAAQRRGAQRRYPAETAEALALRLPGKGAFRR